MHQITFIMYRINVNHKAYQWEGSYAYSSVLTPTSRHNFMIFLPSQISEESLYDVTHGLHNANRLPSSIWIENTMSGAKHKCSNDQITSARPTTPSASSLYDVTHGLHNANRLPSSIWIENTMSGAKRKCSNDQITSARPTTPSVSSLYDVTHGLHNANRLPSSIRIENTMSGAKRKCSNYQITSAWPTTPSVSSSTLHQHHRYFFTLWWVILFTCYHQNSS